MPAGRLGRLLALAAALGAARACDRDCLHGGVCGGDPPDEYCDCDTFYEGDFCEVPWNDIGGWQALWVAHVVLYTGLFAVVGAYAASRLLELRSAASLVAQQSTSLTQNILSCTAIFCLSRAVWQVNQYDYGFGTAYMWEIFFQMGYPALSWAYFCVLATWSRTVRQASGVRRKASRADMQKRKNLNKLYHLWLITIGLVATVCVSLDWHATAAMRTYYISFAGTVAWLCLKFKEYGGKIREQLQAMADSGSAAGDGGGRQQAQDKVGLFVGRLMGCIVYAVVAAMLFTTIWQLRGTAWPFFIFNTTCRAAEVYMVLLLLSVCKLPRAKSRLWAWVSVALLGALEADRVVRGVVRRASNIRRSSAGGVGGAGGASAAPPVAPVAPVAEEAGPATVNPLCASGDGSEEELS